MLVSLVVPESIWHNLAVRPFEMMEKLECRKYVEGAEGRNVVFQEYSHTGVMTTGMNFLK